jgi:hypothetical protein
MEELNEVKYIGVSIPVSPSHASTLCNLNLTKMDLKIPLTDGSHCITTKLMDIGNLRNNADDVLQAQVTFWYDFNSENNTITFCSNDLVSKDSMYLTTVLRGTSQSCVQHTYSNDNNSGKTNPNWNYNTPLTPNLQSLLHQTIRDANTVIIDAAEKLDLTVRVRTPPPQINENDFEKLSAVYYKGRFMEYYNPEKIYDNNHSINNILSTWGGTVKFAKSDNFANVIGSTGDKKIAGKSWLQLWQMQFGQAQTCASLDYKKFPCEGGLVGGHVIIGTKAKKVTYGANDVYIIPICTDHNNNDNVYVAPVIYDRGVWLINYHKP